MYLGTGRAQVGVRVKDHGGVAEAAQDVIENSTAAHVLEPIPGDDIKGATKSVRGEEGTA
jgi:hypothetical protein